MNNRLVRQFEKEVYKWPGVQKAHWRYLLKGHNVYQVNRRTFAEIEGGELTLMRVAPEHKEILYRDFNAHQYMIGERGHRLFTTIPLDDKKLEKLWPIIRQSYEHALTWKGA